MELQNLDPPHPNLLRHFATCQVGDRCYALFPWADGGTLKDLWRSKDLTPRDAIFIRWCLQQMHDLVGALEALHNTNYRHGDIKPDNILYFTSGNPFCDAAVKQEVLMLADFGVSRKHIEPTSLRLDGTTTKATTASYEAPETVSKADLPRSRQYDMWSTGCVLLEFCVWLLYGCAAVDAFREKRLHATASYPMNLDASFYVRLEDREIDEINPAVKKAMKAIRDDQRCGGRTVLGDLLELIQDDLLLIDAKKRDSSPKCRVKLSQILSNASENISYLVKTVDPLPDVPDIFVETKKPQLRTNLILKHDN